MTTSQPYRNPPLALAVLELRHPQVETLGRGELAAMKQQLIRHTPLPKTEEVTDVQFQVQAGNPVSATRTRTVHRFLSRDKQTSIAFGAENMSIETTAYRGWDLFRELVRVAVTARQDIAPIDGFERIGLRYIDEIRVPENGVIEWGEWINQELLPPRLDGLQPLQQQSVVQYGTANSAETLTLRYGAMEGEPVVQNGPGLLRPNLPGSGKYFLIDTDAAWTLPVGTPVPEVDHRVVLEIADELHAPVKGLFEALITDRLRKEVLGVD